MKINKILTLLSRAYKRGFFYTITYLFWISKFYLFKFLNVKKFLTKYDILCFKNYNDSTFKFYCLGQYGFFYSNYLKNYPTSFVFIDIGANQGLYSIIAAKNIKCEKVISFEPVNLTFNYLVKNCSLNNVTQKHDFYNLAISDTNENLKIFFNKNHTGKSSLVKSNQNYSDQVIKIETINHLKLNKLITIKNKNLILKIDVEGHEFIVLKELFKCDFAKFISNIFYEIDDRWNNANLIEKILRNHGFRTFKKIGKDSHYDIMASK